MRRIDILRMTIEERVPEFDLHGAVLYLIEGKIKGRGKTTSITKIERRLFFLLAVKKKKKALKK